MPPPPRAAVLAGIRPGAALSQRQWSALVEAWNGLRAAERREQAAACREHGHQWVGTPVGACCRACLSYR